MRLRLGLTQRQMASALGVTQQFIQQMEAGRRQLPMGDREGRYSGIWDRYLELWEAAEYPQNELDEAQRETFAKAHAVPAQRGPYKGDGA